MSESGTGTLNSNPFGNPAKIVAYGVSDESDNISDTQSLNEEQPEVGTVVLEHEQSEGHVSAAEKEPLVNHHSTTSVRQSECMKITARVTQFNSLNTHQGPRLNRPWPPPRPNMPSYNRYMHWQPWHPPTWNRFPMVYPQYHYQQGGLLGDRPGAPYNAWNSHFGISHMTPERERIIGAFYQQSPTSYQHRTSVSRAVTVHNTPSPPGTQVRTPSGTDGVSRRKKWEVLDSVGTTDKILNSSLE